MKLLHMLKNKKVIISLAVVALTAALALGTTWAVSAASMEKAKSTAKEMIPAGAVLVESEKEDNHYELTYYDSAEKMLYEVEVDRKTGKVKEMKVRAEGILGSDTVVLGEEEVRQAVKAVYPDAEVQSVVLTSSSPRKYVAEFKAADYSGRMLINPETGAVMEKKIKFGTPVVIPVTSLAPDATGAYISASQAAEAAKALVPGGTLLSLLRCHAQCYQQPNSLLCDHTTSPCSHTCHRCRHHS